MTIKKLFVTKEGNRMRKELGKAIFDDIDNWLRFAHSGPLFTTDKLREYEKLKRKWLE